MYSPFRLAAKFIRYYITASNGKGHGIHSPFVFDFVTRVLNDKRKFSAYHKIEGCRSKLLSDRRLLDIDDFGAGNASGARKHRTVQEIAKNAAKSKKFGQLLFRIAHYYQPACIVELGTSLGLSAAYLALGHPAAKLITCEGAASVAAVASENFASLNIANIKIINGNFDDTLPPLLQDLENIDLAFIDGNHRRIPTLSYFKKLQSKTGRPGMLIFDDIHWSKEMEAAWQEIKNDPDVMLTIDLFFVGLVCYSAAFKRKQHFVIRF
ncbi:MAG: class I SAM-dependent methyltransferase [Chitinophagaceae bacterium]